MALILFLVLLRMDVTLFPPALLGYDEAIWPYMGLLGANPALLGYDEAIWPYMGLLGANPALLGYDEAYCSFMAVVYGNHRTANPTLQVKNTNIETTTTKHLDEECKSVCFLAFLSFYRQPNPPGWHRHLARSRPGGPKPLPPGKAPPPRGAPLAARPHAPPEPEPGTAPEAPPGGPWGGAREHGEACVEPCEGVPQREGV
jgi:hypothetical protein